MSKIDRDVESRVYEPTLGSESARLRKGQHDGEDSALTKTWAKRPDLTRVQFNNASHKRQAYPQAPFGYVVVVNLCVQTEDLLSEMGLKTIALVGHREVYRTMGNTQRHMN